MTDEQRERWRQWYAARREDYCRKTGTASADVNPRDFRRWLDAGYLERLAGRRVPPGDIKDTTDKGGG
jgi:hypothetical protein